MKYFCYLIKIAYIKKFNSCNPTIGCNQSPGGDCGPIKLSFNSLQITDILNKYCAGVELRQIAKDLNLKYHTVFDITRLKFSPLHQINELLIKKVRIMKNNSNKRKKINLNLLNSILLDFIENNMTYKDLSKKWNISISNLHSLVHRKTFKDFKIDKDLDFKLKQKLSNRKYWKDE